MLISNNKQVSMSSMSVYEYLSTTDQPRTALQISRSTGIPKRKVNKTLYNDDRFIKFDSTPPRWSTSYCHDYTHIYMDDELFGPVRSDGSTESNIDPKITLVINDLGNVHDISSRIGSYLERSDGLLQYIGVAEKSYNGPKIKGKTTVVSNGEVVLEINYIVHDFSQRDDLGKIIIATKNSMMRKHMTNFYKRHYPDIDMVLVSGFDELKEILDS